MRRVIVNRVLNEVECEPLDVEGQRPIGLLDDSTRVGYIEAYFDHRRWGEEALGAVAAEGALRHPALVDVNLLRVEEHAPLDVTGAVSVGEPRGGALGRDETAVDRKRDAGDVGRLVRGEEQDGRRDLLGAAVAA